MTNISDFGRHNESQSMGTPRWMVSFADLLSLILTFFVLIFSMSTPPKEVVTEKSDYEKNTEAAFSLKKGDKITNIELARTDQTLSTNYLYDIMIEKIAPHPELAKVEVKPLPDHMALSFAAADFNDAMANQMAVLLKTIQNRTEIYSSDIEQSYAIAQKLQENGLKREISFYESIRPEGKIDIIIYP